MTASNSATKIFSIKVKIIGTSNSSNPAESEKLLHYGNFGMCFTGSYLNGSLLADTFGEVLENIQGAEGISDFSIENLTDIAFEIYQDVSRKMIEIHRVDGGSSILIGGFCPEETIPRFYHFFPQQNENREIEFVKEEVEINETPFIIGDNNAKRACQTILDREASNSEYTPFHALREVIRDTSIITVGGNIQAGLFDNHNFRTCGIAEYFEGVDEWGNPTIEQVYSFRGHSLGLDDSSLRKGNINIAKTLLNPFDDERMKLFKKNYGDLD